jgi:hypothetical protein
MWEKIEHMEKRNARRERKAGGDGKFKVAPVTEDKDDGDASLDGAKNKKRSCVWWGRGSIRRCKPLSRPGLEMCM